MITCRWKASASVQAVRRWQCEDAANSSLLIMLCHCICGLRHHDAPASASRAASARCRHTLHVIQHLRLPNTTPITRINDSYAAAARLQSLGSGSWARTLRPTSSGGRPLTTAISVCVEKARACAASACKGGPAGQPGSVSGAAGLQMEREKAAAGSGSAAAASAAATAAAAARVAGCHRALLNTTE